MSFKIINSQQVEKIKAANAKKNTSDNIPKTRKPKLSNLEEKDNESSQLLSRKRKRPAIKRGTNCAWTVEDVKLLTENLKN